MEENERARVLRRVWPAVVAAIALAAAVAAAIGARPAIADGPLVFSPRIIDASLPGYLDNKAVGDIDGDGLPDVVVGTDTQLVWYQAPGWTRQLVAQGANFSTDMQVADVDGDGDVDIVTPQFDAATIEWFRNPLVGGGEWAAVTIGAGFTAHDLEVGDVDGDGRPDVVVRGHAGATTLFRQVEPATWEPAVITAAPDGEGTALGDVDRDGRLDIVQNGYWLAAPADVSDGGAWTKHTFAGEWAGGRVGVAVGDLNGDGRLDAALAYSESEGRMAWYEAPDDPASGTWVEHRIADDIDFVHTFKTADFDNDGDLDVAFAEMEQSEQRRVGIYLNDGGGLSWSQQVLSTNGSHNIRVADIGSDGDVDIVGANWQRGPVELWENRTIGVTPSDSPLDRWTYNAVSADHQGTFGLAFGDLDGDGRADIASGRYWYKNPGGDMTGTWAQSPGLPDGVHAILVTDVDGDALSDVIGQANSGGDLYWLEATSTEAIDWTSVRMGTVPAASHGLGTQGFRLAQLEAGGRPEVVLSTGGGLYYFRIPETDAGSGGWPVVHVTPDAYDEGVGVGDLDGDGDLDLTAGTSGLDVRWFRNPGDGTSNWDAFTIGSFVGFDGFPDRFAVADVDGDGRVDVVTSEENGAESGASTLWWRQPADPTTPGWEPRLIASQGSTNSMDVADLDGDGDVDLVTGEHRGALTVAVWENDGAGRFTRHVVDQGRESHLGTQLFDLDGDGDLDITSIGFDAPADLHLWRNDQASSDRGTGDGMVRWAHDPLGLGWADAGGQLPPGLSP